MTDNIPAFKKEIDEIPVPMDKLDAIIATTVAEHAPKRKNSFRKKMVYSAGAAAVAFGLLIGSASVSPAMANIVSQIPLIGSIFSESGDAGLVQVSDLGMTQIVGASETVKGDTLTINEVFYDETRLTVSYSLETKEPMDESYFTNGFPDIYVNGRSPSSYGGSLEEKDITPTYRTGLFSIDAMTDLPDEFTLGLKFESEEGQRWKFKIPVKAQSNVDVLAIDETQQAGDVSLSVTELKSSPAGLLIHFDAEADEDFFLMSNIEFKVIDDMGHELGIHSGGSQGTVKDGREFFSGNRLFDPIGDDVKKLTITPVVEHASEGGGVSIEGDGTETQFELEPYSGEPIEFESFTVELP
ncbi:hypothetic; protein [Bacillus sp. OxB-1]|uniref:DUF4179 domain-containing protein n=1 Tax=Bacillus sp. (strain OxB-1) TaxID=98228 RepID=UPI000581E823|nr:DUF4179 domain-containing protein [Bacillus sp. OxB-1]BAQ09021.1 hypothetic; protein [Bacillus sp. OxB-1]